MLNYVWGIIIIASIICSVFTGNTKQLGEATLQGASDGLTLLLTMLPMLALWSGLMEIAQKSGITQIIAKIFSPILKRLFPDIDVKGNAFKCICMNISANLLGLGNAATPFGLQAMNELKRLNPHSDTASDSMVIFVVINTASVQILPTMVGVLRQGAGSNAPFEILPCVWITSIIALTSGLIVAKVFNFDKKVRQKALKK